MINFEITAYGGRSGSPQYWHPYVLHDSFTVIIAPVDQDDVVEVNRMLEAEASPAEINAWLNTK